MRLFVYGSLLSGEGNHGRLGASRLIGEARTEPRYTLVSLGAFPALLGGGTTSVAGEVYDVDADTLVALDAFEGHPRFYRRERVVLLGDDGAESYVLPRVRGGTYPIIVGGDWREFRCGLRS